VYTKGSAYVVPNSSARRGHTASYKHDYYEEGPPQPFPKVRYAPQFEESNIQYSSLPYSASQRSDGLYVS
jgi:hypothetical protein